MIKRSSIAGRWYASNPGQLAKEIDGMIDKAAPVKNNDMPLLLIVPHAGYMYSGNTAASGYRAVKDSAGLKSDPEVIVIIAPSHHKGIRGCVVFSADYYETPLGKIKLDKDAAKALVSNNLFADDPQAFENEHAAEIQFPFLQRIFGGRLESDIRVLPIIAGNFSDSDAVKIAEAIRSVIKGRPLFIISSDFTHYGPDYGYLPFKYSEQTTPENLKSLDMGAVEFILKKDLKAFSAYIDKTDATICGRNPIRIALGLKISDFKAKQLMYETSGKITGDYTNSVSYTSILFYGKLDTNISVKEEKESSLLTSENKKFLLKIARDNIESWLANRKPINVPAEKISGILRKKSGAFVTLHSKGKLRGCIGYVSAEMPLIDTVLENSYNAAFRDPRFDQLQKSEMKDISIEISVLTDPVPVKSPDEIKTGRDGLIIERGGYRGLLLPQVATEQGWDKFTFLDQTCVKAGLSSDSWKKEGTKIFKFEAIVFGEEE